MDQHHRLHSIDLFTAGVIVLCLNSKSLLCRLFAAAPLVALGRISYGFYVIHDIPHFGYELLIDTFFHGNRHISLWAAVLAYPATITLAALSFRFFESPILRLKDRFTLRATVPSPHP